MEEQNNRFTGMKAMHERNYGKFEPVKDFNGKVNSFDNSSEEALFKGDLGSMKHPNQNIPKILFFDTETSDFIKKDLPANDPEQAWTVQIGALLTDLGGNEIDKLNVIIKANGRTMNHYAEEVHGISVERADAEGIEELEAAERFGILLRQASLVVGHNFDFDWKYAQHLLERNMDNLSDEARSAFYLDLPNQCTMKDKAIVKFCGLKNKAGRPKWPKLIELHEILFEETFDGAHDAFADITATARCFFELVDRGIINMKL